MKYLITFPEYHLTSNYLSVSVQFLKYRLWLEENIGKQDVHWKYVTGDLHAQGVYLPTEEDVVMFKLKFKI